MVLVGGGNSAGQAAIYLSKFARKVEILIRRDTLKDTMSSYLIDQIKLAENIHVVGETVIEEALGKEHLEAIVFKNLKTGELHEKPAAALFLFIGAQPMSNWLPSEILKSEKGFICTGPDLKFHKDFKKIWELEREPFALETSIPGIFTAGDVRSGAMNRVASAVGEGAMAISHVHQYLAEI